MIGTGIIVFALMQAAKQPMSTVLPIRGLHIDAPNAAGVERFAKFVREALPKEGVNTLVLEIDYRFKFKKHPEIAEKDSLTEAQVKEIARACVDAHVRLIPQINLLGHQSWAANTESLLKVHPEFDETRGKYPNNKGIYCRSYCPNAPGLHQVIFDSIDELCDACGSDAFHCGMDEVFILADPDCPNCKGKTAAECFAGEVTALHDHIVSTGRQMWMWGDRFIDGRANGLGEWEASTNGSYAAINQVPKDIVICDWHYEHAEPTPAYFAMNGFPVVASPWRNSSLAIQQLNLIEAIRKGANGKIAQKAQGVLHTTWCGADAFIKAYNGDLKQNRSVEETVKCFKDLFKAVREADSGEGK
jgi:hypothetical protein